MARDADGACPTFGGLESHVQNEPIFEINVLTGASRVSRSRLLCWWVAFRRTNQQQTETAEGRQMANNLPLSAQVMLRFKDGTTQAERNQIIRSTLGWVFCFTSRFRLHLHLVPIGQIDRLLIS